MSSVNGNRQPRRPFPSRVPPLRPLRESALPHSREAMIRDAAYRRSAARGFAPGFELQDWLAAERQVDELLAREIPFGFYG